MQDRVAFEQQKIASDYDRMLRALSEIGYLTADEAGGLPLDLAVDIRDLRTDRKRPLQ